jgi:preprotein translocase subunit YajC
MKGNDPKAFFNLILFGGMMVLLWVMLIMPQRKQQKLRKQMLESLKVGDKIVTTGGIYGVITKISENSMRVKIARDTEIRITRAGVTQKTSKEEDEKD